MSPGAIRCCATAMWLSAGCGGLVAYDTTGSASGGASPGNGGTYGVQTASGGTGGLVGAGGTVASVTSGGTKTTTGGATAQPQAIAISAGSFHTCALMSDGTIRCWGSNEQGRLGNGTYDDSFAPTDVYGITSATVIDTGGQHNCALLRDNTIRCWGGNDTGQLGDGTTTSSAVPVMSAVGLSNAIAVSAGNQHTCALDQGGTVWCWGDNRSGQLGQPPSDHSSVPVPLDGLAPAHSISTGRAHTCAILDKADFGAVACWGSNSEFQLGATTSSMTSSTPVGVQGLGLFVASSIAAGSQHNCANVNNTPSGGLVWCWGWNYYGQAGSGSTPDTGAIDVTGISTATSITAADHSCALLSDGRVQCWGFNSSGELGNGSTRDTSSPTLVSGVSNAVMVSAGPSHTCALLSTGQVECWGDNFWGELGDGSTNDSPVPVTVMGL
jgi:alpha-tubulin suppressor-like RCC1 family protein